MNIFLACALTVVIETLFFVLCGYRTKLKILVVALTNIVSNLVMNLLLLLLTYRIGYSTVLVIALEFGVLVFEYVIYALAFGRSSKLFILTAAANLISFTAGLIINAVIA